MHLIHEEHGHSTAHGAGKYGQEEAGKREKALALLSYMLEHNEHHAKELEEVADNLEEEGFQEAAEEIRAGVLEFQRGNGYLKKALGTVQDGTEK